jgi:hypothetical protein
MSDAEKQLLLDAIHEQLDHAISYNLWTGLAYGKLRSNPSFFGFFLFFSLLCVLLSTSFGI